MTEYRSPDNPDVFVIPPRKRSQKEIDDAAQRELESSHLRGELASLYQEIPKYETRLDELQRIQTLITMEAERLKDELKTAEARKSELETLFKG